MKPEEYPNDIKQWLNDRGITDEVLFHYNISVVDRRIVIPVYSSSGEFLFNKYRRDPFTQNTQEPKYKYDKGATSALYGVTSAIGPVVIVEGELDALCLTSKGYYAVSTTGGAGTFKDEWADLLKEREIYICYDNDDSGRRGIIKLLDIFPYAKVIFLPKGSKDVTEFFQKHAASAWLALYKSAQQWRLPKDPVDEEKKSLKAYIAECRDVSEYLSGERTALLRDGKDTAFVDMLLQHITALYDVVNRKLKYTRPTIRDGDAINRARAVPITEYIKVVKGGYALCVAHSEKTPSMKYYKKNNKVKCFGCGFNGDTVDVVQKIFGLSVGDAIKKINGN